MPPSTDWMFNLADAVAELSPEVRAHYGLRRGTMRVGVYAPVGTDPQPPHKQDELYIVVSGTGEFVKDGEVRPFTTGDVIFVEAGAEHRFQRFSPDFLTWVVFWGPSGGEA